jgi:AcrR family transcriptional regulator
MKIEAVGALEPRKRPVQTRSAVTVRSICEAAIQVLLSHGAERFTTTRVASRAGVSVGTLYQYFPNKRALLFAVLRDHMGRVTGAVEAACERARGKALDAMIREMVEAFVDAKMMRADISMALYKVASDVGGEALVKREALRMRKAVVRMLESAPEIAGPLDEMAVQMMMAAMAGVIRSVLEGGASVGGVRKVREHLVVMCGAYMGAVCVGTRR